MAIDFKRAQKPCRKLRKLLKKMSAKPSPEQVHDFRTNSRQMEATLQAFELDSRRVGKRVLKPLSRLRKRAGKVRDMDVLTAYATSVRPDEGEQDCAVQLLEHLGAQRRKYARKFHSASRQDGSKLVKSLKRVERKLGKTQERVEEDGRSTSKPSSSALDVGASLASVRRLNHSNLHPFRLKVKDLRNILKIAEAPDQEFVDALGNVKDAIGEWHDWEELVGIGEKVLDHGAQCRLIQKLKTSTRQKYDAALSQAEQLRQRYFGISSKKKSPRSRPAAPAEPLLRAAMKLVA